MSRPPPMLAPGPFRSDQLAPGDPYELSNGHAIRVMPGGGRHSRANSLGGLVVGTDPAVKSIGIDAGFSPRPGDLRAPDVAVMPDGDDEDNPGWIKGVPPLAIEYADRSQDEDKLQEKITDLLTMGTKYLWVVRLDGIRRVEVYELGKPPVVVGAGGVLTAPGVLALPVPAEALWDPDAAQKVADRNLLARFGYKNFDEIRAEGHAIGKTEGKAEGHAIGKTEGKAEGKAEGTAYALLAVLGARGLVPTGEERARILAADEATLTVWVPVAVTASTVAEILAR